MTIKIVPSMSYKTYGTHAFGLGLVSQVDSTKEGADPDGNVIFAHKLMESVLYENLTDEQRKEIKADCDELVRLLSKFYHEDEYVEE